MMKGSKTLFLLSWIILLLLSVFMILGSAGSLWIAYTGSQENLTPTVTLEQIKNVGGEEAVAAFKGRRATAATWALATAILIGWVAFVPYRRGERWAWWALLVAVGLSQFLSLARAITLGANQGTSTAGTVLAVLLLGLLAGAPRMFAGRDTPPEL